MRAFQVLPDDQPPSLRTIDIPAPAEGEVRLRIGACGLNFADTLMIRGEYQDTPEPPFTLGMEVAGTVEACGPGVDDAMIGQRVAVFGHARPDFSPGPVWTSLRLGLPDKVAPFATPSNQLAHCGRRSNPGSSAEPSSEC